MSKRIGKGRPVMLLTAIMIAQLACGKTPVGPGPPADNPANPSEQTRPSIPAPSPTGEPPGTLWASQSRQVTSSLSCLAGTTCPDQRLIHANQASASSGSICCWSTVAHSRRQFLRPFA
jgi:hypothetical protein